MHASLRHLKSRGFTIIELLVVIVVIGILAAITIVTYNGVQKNAIDKSILSDADSLTGPETRYATNNGTGGKAWYSGSGADTDLQFTPSPGNIIDVATNVNDYCIRAYNPNSSTYTSLAKAMTKESSPGVCISIDASVAAQTASPYVNGNVVTTFAGSGASASLDGTGTAAQFTDPSGIAIAGDGTMYVVEGTGSRIRKMTTSGVVTTFAGSGTIGAADGTGAAAQFYYPRGIAIDSTGNLFVADFQNNRIRKITPNAVVTTFAGSTSGYVDGTGAAAKFAAPNGIVIDSNDNLYVTDTNNYRIRKITSAGVVTTLAGSTVGYADGTGAAAQFNIPQSIVMDTSGVLYVTDKFNNMIRKVTTAGVVTTVAGATTSGYVDATGTSARFKWPDAMAIDGVGNLYVSDQYGNSYIRKITSAGVVTTLAGGAGGYADGTGAAARFQVPIQGIAIDSNLKMYIVDTTNSRIRVMQ
ncbi:MAG: hypothetical protein JWN12_5 [Candidatus Saccharibacteria bacterium]|nr:hypothetical protein [Candidatus Saccharibacteria bacterium]